MTGLQKFVVTALWQSRQQKKRYYVELDIRLEDSLWLEKVLFGDILTTPDSEEGTSAFIEKQIANFSST